MATEGNDETNPEPAEENPTVESLQAQLEAERRDKERFRKLADHRESVIKQHQAERKKAADAGLPEPEKLVHRLRETETAREQAERERDEERAGRRRDRQDAAILTAAAKLVDPDFLDLVPDRIDRDLLDLDDDGRIVAGLDRAVADLVKRRPKWALPKKPDGGTGTVRHPHGGANAGPPSNPVAVQLGRKTSLGT